MYPFHKTDVPRASLNIPVAACGHAPTVRGARRTAAPTAVRGDPPRFRLELRPSVSTGATLASSADHVRPTCLFPRFPPSFPLRARSSLQSKLHPHPTLNRPLLAPLFASHSRDTVCRPLPRACVGSGGVFFYLYMYNFIFSLRTRFRSMGALLCVLTDNKNSPSIVKVF